MPLNVIDRPGKRGSQFFDQHKTVAEFHEEYATSNGYYCKGKYGCLLFETEIRIEDTDMARISIKQKRALEGVGTVINQSMHTEHTKVMLHDQKNTSHTSIKPYSLFSRLLGYRKIINSPFGIKSKFPISLSSESLVWMEANEFYSAVQDEDGLEITISRVFKTENEMESLVSFLKHFLG